MGELVNLRQERKRKDRDQKAKKADANRALYGRSRGERRLTDAEHQKADKHLDAHLLSSDETGPVSDAVENSDPHAVAPISQNSGAQQDDAASATGKSNVVSIFAPNIPDRP